MQAALTAVYGKDLARLAEARTAGFTAAGNGTPGAHRGAGLAHFWSVWPLRCWPRRGAVAALRVCALRLGGEFHAEMAGLAHDVRAGPTNRGARPPPAARSRTRRPVVTILVPLFNEPDIAANLLRRLTRIDYPSELLDVLLLIEESDRRRATR